ncbi:MAG: hypothetical protein K1X67_03415 [Fimbriimonadaceae bacterium]|nr:hypothetical protein [Fimbriimonadaceae bacterium]
MNLIRRSIALLTASMMLLSATAEGWAAMSRDIKRLLHVRSERVFPVYPDTPRAVNRGENPGRAPETRGGQYKLRLRADLAEYRNRRHGRENVLALSGWGNLPELWLSLLDLDPPGGGSPGPGEGGMNAGLGTLNTLNGNKLTAVPIVGWNARGTVDMGFTLYHNSLADDVREMGAGWSHSYDIDVEELADSAIVHWSDGRIWQYEEGTGGSYSPPAGRFDTLEKLTSTTWRLTLVNHTVLNFTQGSGISTNLLSSIVDRNGNTTTISRSSNLITTISDPNSRTLTFSYSGGLIESVTDPLSREWTFTHGGDYLETITYPTVTHVDSTTSTPERNFTYVDLTDDIVVETDTRGKEWTYSYTDGHLQWSKDPYDNQTTYTYDPDVTEITEPGSIVTKHHYDDGKLVAITDEAGYVDERTVDKDGLITQYIDRRNKEYNFTYDAKGRMLTYVNPYTKTWTLTYNGYGDLTSIDDPVNSPWTITYFSGGLGRIEKVTDPLSRDVVNYTYDSYGLVDSVEDALGRTTAITRNSKGEITSLTKPGESAYDITYDAISRPTVIENPYNQSTARQYDALGRVKKVTLPDSDEVKSKFDGEGNVTDIWDQLDRHTTFTYEDRGLLATVTNANSETESYTYDERALLTMRTNGRGKTTEYIRALRGEVDTIVYADGLEETFSYDANGNHTWWTTLGFSQAKNHEYDDAGRLTKIDYYAGTDTTFTYDDADRMTQMVDASGTSSWTYNGADEVTQLTTPQGTVNYVYKDDGQLEKIQQSGLSDLVYRYDSYGRVDRVTSAFSEVTDITYDGTGSRVTRKDLPNGNYETYTYDVRGRVEDIVLKNSGHTVLRKLEHTYDAVDNITEIVETRGSAVTKTFGYDDIDQLISEDWSTGYTADYEYDANGNRTKRTVGATVEDYFYDDSDKLTEIKIGGSVTKSFDYDVNGRRTEMTDGGGTTYYGYDMGDRLTSITRSGLTTNSFSYNGFDTRVSKTDSTGTTSYKRAGAGVTSSLLRSTVSSTSTDYTPGISSRVSSTSTFMHSGLKNSDEQSGSGGTISASLQYDAFGKQVSSSGTWVGAFQYGGAYGYQTDPDHGLKLLGHRYYEADTGRFLTRDPIKDGRNWYGYCGNEPVGRADASGFQFSREFNEAMTNHFSGGSGASGSMVVDPEGYPVVVNGFGWNLINPSHNAMTIGGITYIHAEDWPHYSSPRGKTWRNHEHWHTVHNEIGFGGNTSGYVTSVALSYTLGHDGSPFEIDADQHDGRPGRPKGSIFFGPEDLPYYWDVAPPYGQWHGGSGAPPFTIFPDPFPLPVVGLKPLTW